MKTLFLRAKNVPILYHNCKSPTCIGQKSCMPNKHLIVQKIRIRFIFYSDPGQHEWKFGIEDLPYSYVCARTRELWLFNTNDDMIDWESSFSFYHFTSFGSLFAPSLFILHNYPNLHFHCSLLNSFHFRAIIIILTKECFSKCLPFSPSPAFMAYYYVTARSFFPSIIFHEEQVRKRSRG